jgi:uncharacterized membrane protein YccF (DUF307 family)
MASFGNLIWFVLGGGIWALIWLLIAGIFALTIIGIPIARACLEFAKLSAFPFGKEIIRDTELLGENNVSTATKSANKILGIIWFPFGLILTILYFALALTFFVSLIGIPFGIAYVRIGKFVLFPMGARVVSKKDAYAIAAANETVRRMNTAGVQGGTGDNTTASNIQQAPVFALSKGQVIATATVIGVLVCYLLFRFVRIPGPFLNSYVLAQSIVSAMAVIFGGIAGGIIGFLGGTLNLFMNLFIVLIHNGLNGINYYPEYIISSAIILGIHNGLFGLLTGIICQRFVLGKKENSMLKNVVFVFLITLVLAILTRLISSIFNDIRVFINRGTFVGNFINIILYNLKNLMYNLKGSLVIGILSSLAAFIYLKLRAKKEISPVEETREPEQNTTQDNEAQE